jgi:hypothetical protein
VAGLEIGSGLISPALTFGEVVNIDQRMGGWLCHNVPSPLGPVAVIGDENAQLRSRLPEGLEKRDADATPLQTY